MPDDLKGADDALERLVVYTAMEDGQLALDCERVIKAEFDFKDRALALAGETLMKLDLKVHDLESALSRIQEERAALAAFLVDQIDEPDPFHQMGARGHYWRDKCITAGRRLDPQRWGLGEQGGPGDG